MAIFAGVPLNYMGIKKLTYFSIPHQPITIVPSLSEIGDLSCNTSILLGSAWFSWTHTLLIL